MRKIGYALPIFGFIFLLAGVLVLRPTARAIVLRHYGEVSSQQTFPREEVPCDSIRRLQVLNSSSDFRFRKPFAYPPAQSFLIVGLEPATVDHALHRVEQQQPILERRLWHGLPLIEALRAHKKTPVPAHALRIDLEFDALLGHALPTDFGFGHFL
jgi:hypothetical protein